MENCIDRISKDWHELSKAAKDIGSLLVFLSFVNLILCWVIVCFV
ncbi:MAG: diacylglycerol kinase [Bdellovibrionota bacterium]|nr:diacylglycerol kinase [Bdellovibrionota bacterium]